jgi:predicted O-linked N-acetylglucosamine transferase (SPINDLY family)
MEINDPDAALDVAIEYHQTGRIKEAEALYRRILEVDPGHPGALYLLGGIAYQNGAHAEAFALIDEVLRDEPADPDAQHLFALINQRLGDIALALESVGRALALNPGYAHAWLTQGNVQRDAQRFEDALVSYARALALQDNSVPMMGAEIHCGRGLALIGLGQPAQALADFDAAIALDAGSAAAHAYRGNTLNDLRRYPEAARAYARVLELAPTYSFVRGKQLHCELQTCDWRSYAFNDVSNDAACSPAQIRAAVRRGELADVPFSFLMVSADPAEQLQCAQQYTRNQYPAMPPLWTGERYRHDRIRIAYLSADFHNHATAFLMAELFEAHDRTQFECNAVSFGPSANDAMRGRLERAFDRFNDMRNASNAEIANWLRAHEIDIAIDLKGLTGGSRAGIFAYRAAPLQVGYIGYPGTVGAPWLDYIIGDAVVTPPGHEAFYTEQIVRLPDSYQANDSRRAIAAHTPTRAEAGLPASGFVFSCFNDNYKITPEVFAIWMRLLRQVEGSVLWLFQGNLDAVANLRRAAVEHGIAAERLVFAPRLELPEHLARQRLADLFLDTLPVNAHTTASDALWAGLPLVTCLGSAFAGRVAASLLHAVGLPELVAANLADYEALALRLATAPTLLAEIRARLARQRSTRPLFDSTRFRLHLESAYRTMYQRHCQGLPPAGFEVEPVSSIA